MKRQKSVFYIILAVVLITGMSFSIYTISTIRSIRGLRAALEQKAAERAHAVEIDAGEGIAVSRYIPQKSWTTEFIETAYSASRKYGIRDLTFVQKSVDSPRRQTQAGGRLPFNSYPVRMSFHSGYREMAEFIADLQGSQRLITIDSLKVSRDKDALVIEMTAGTYAMEEN